MEKKRKYRTGSNENNLVEPFKNTYELKIINLDSAKNKYEKEEKEKLSQKKVSFCSRLFFSWTFIIMKLSNKKKLKKEFLLSISTVKK